MLSKINNKTLMELRNFTSLFPNMSLEEEEDEDPEEPYDLKVVYEEKIILSNLNHFQEYNIEVRTLEQVALLNRGVHSDCFHCFTVHC